jgi:hypothetical protein
MTDCVEVTTLVIVDAAWVIVVAELLVAIEVTVATSPDTVNVDTTVL